jgi:hypothetical protein
MTGGTTVRNRRRPKAIRIPRSCQRCRRRLTASQVRAGMARVSAGRVTATVCESCLTPGDLAQMVIRECTEEYGLNVRDELIYQREAGSDDDDAWRLAGGVSR